jgi:hypothetical protein
MTHRTPTGERLFTGILEDLAPLKRMDIRNFVTRFVAMSQPVEGETPEEAEDRLMRRQEFGLCGRLVAEGRQVFLDATVSTLDRETLMNFKRDYDSYSGFYLDIPVRDDLLVYPIARHEDTLSDNMHILCEMTTYEGVSPIYLGSGSQTVRLKPSFSIHY